jgi:hypothetical protein
MKRYRLIIPKGDMRKQSYSIIAIPRNEKVSSGSAAGLDFSAEPGCYAPNTGRHLIKSRHRPRLSWSIPLSDGCDDRAD